MVDGKIRSHTRLKDFSVLYASACAAFVSVIAVLYPGKFGTHRAIFHVTAVALYAIYFIPTGAQSLKENLRRLLSFPNNSRWMYLGLALGVVSGLLRFA